MGKIRVGLKTVFRGTYPGLRDNRSSPDDKECGLLFIFSHVFALFTNNTSSLKYITRKIHKQTKF